MQSTTTPKDNDSNSGAATLAAPLDIIASETQALPNKTWNSFGVGCFHFSHRTPGVAEKPLDPDQYYDKLKTALSSVANITEIEIVPAEHFEDYLDDDWPAGKHPDIAAGYGIYPWPLSGYVQFEIFLPKRVQEKIIGEFRAPSNVEIFLVKIIYGRGLPIAFVRSATGYTDAPSTLVTIVWRYLKECLGSDDDDIKFELVGPSPCHTDFYIRTHDDKKYDIKYVENSGYDSVEISAPITASVDDVWSSVEYRIRAEYREFYAVVKERNYINRNLSEILYEADSIIEDKLSKKILKNPIKAILSRKKILELTLRSERAELEVTSLLQKLQQTIETIERDWSFSVAKPKLRRETRELEQIPLPSYKRMLSTLDGNSSVSSTNQTAVIAAVVGALVSVAMTLFIQSMIERPAGASPVVIDPQTSIEATPLDAAGE